MAYLAAVIAIIITSLVVDRDADSADPFNVEQNCATSTFVTIGYMINRA